MLGALLGVAAMSREIHKLSDLKVKKLKTAGRHADGGNLYFVVEKGGSRWWAFMYRWGEMRNGKRPQVEMGIGGYPDVSLAQAREMAQELRGYLARGIAAGTEQDQFGGRAQDEAAAHVPLFARLALFGPRAGGGVIEPPGCHHAQRIW